MIASAYSLRQVKPIIPFCERTQHNGMSYGVSYAGYDVRIDRGTVIPAGKFTLAATLEQFVMPIFWLGVVHDKSTWARRGLAVQNTVIEPGWKGYLTLELTNHSEDDLVIKSGDPIAQIIFHNIDGNYDRQGYDGKYQNQKRGPQEAILTPDNTEERYAKALELGLATND